MSKSASHPFRVKAAGLQAKISSLERRRRTSSNWPLAALGAFLVLYVGWQAFNWLPGGRREVGDLFFLPIDAAAALAAWLASRRCRECRWLRRFWRLFAAALVAQLLGDAAMAVYDLGSGQVPSPSLADPPYLAFYLLIGAALLSVPLAPTTRAQRKRIALDMAIAVLGGGMAIWYLVLAPTLAQGDGSALRLGVSIAYPLGDVVLLASLAIMALRWSPPTLRLPLGLIAVGLAMFMLADVIYGYLLLHGGYGAGEPLDMLWIGAMSLFAIAPTRQQPVRQGAPEVSIPGRAPTERRVSWLPFAALVIGSAILIDAERQRPLVGELGLVLVAIILAILIALRQYVTQREMIRLQGDLRAAHDALSHLASHDALTGMPNRRSIDENLEAELERAKRYRRALSILFLDVDRFKAINDDHGHATGDEALREFAELLRGCLRPADLPSRWGGEEFVVVLPETGSAEAAEVAERIRATVADHRFSFAEVRGLTCSIGLSSYPKDGSEALTLLNRADRALYRAKRNGRNCVIVGRSRPPSAL